MPDRELTAEETKQLVYEKVDDIFEALKVFKEEKSKPSLHDLCLLELGAKLEAVIATLIKQGRKIKALEGK
ncbi:hypothetical protein ES703_02113 [subsurface metagenome]